MDYERKAKPPGNGWAALFAPLSKPNGQALDSRGPGKKRKEPPMRQLNYDLKLMCQRNRDGSYATQADRERCLALIADQLYEMGFKKMRASSLKPRHVTALVKRWNAEGLSTGTLKNRMAHLRWWAEKQGKRNIIARSNEAYGIENRVYVTNVSKARELTVQELERVSDPYTALSLRFQAEFGLRREESLKIRPAWADRGDKLALKASWAKGSRYREIPIRTPEQRALLAEAKALAGKGSLIPVDMRYKDQLERFKSQCQGAGIHKVHGHRHCYAQERYRELAGWECPAQGGPTSKQLTPEQKARDGEARLAISAELGHSRAQITAVYCGQ
jgi:hypothetical protein